MTTTRVERWGTLGLALGLVLAGGPVRAAVGPAAKGASSAGAKGAGAKGAGGSGEASSVQGEEEPGSGEGEGGESGESGEGEGVEGEGLPTDGLVLDPAEADRANAEQAYREGSDLYELGKYPEAIERFQRAWELSKEVQLLYNLGQAQWKWFDVDPDIDHLRQAALFFRNYDKRMRLVEGYDQVEIDNILKAIDAQIENEERKIAEANRPVIVQPGGPTEEELAWERRRRTTRALNISGTTIIVVGSVTLAAGL
ncbi:MAG: tetratricopeptide repeat protein, partial [Myxococcales bacterium]|nr:tetratricopeptide repeat protein [Myxococcales bacterium]